MPEYDEATIKTNQDAVRVAHARVLRAAEPGSDRAGDYTAARQALFDAAMESAGDVTALLAEVDRLRDRLSHATAFTVSILPSDNINHHLYAIKVEYRGRGTWAVSWMGECLGADGEWDYEPIPSERSDEWLAAHRFDLEAALRLAQEVAPDVVVNGISAVQAAIRIEASRG